MDIGSGSGRAALYQTPNGFLWASAMASDGLWIARSTNDGATWSSAVNLMVPLDGGQTVLTHFVDGADAYVAVTAVENGDDIEDYGRLTKFLFFQIDEDDASWAAVSMAEGTLTISGIPLDGETVTIDGKTYTFEDTLTDSDGNVAIGGSQAQAQANLVAAFDLSGTAGVDYAASTLVHPTVVIGDFAGNAAVVTARESGTSGNSIPTIETLGSGGFAGATLTGGASPWTAEAEDILISSASGMVGTDDELSVTRDSSDNIYVVGETQRHSGAVGPVTDDPQIVLFKRTPVGDWSQHDVKLDQSSSTSDRKRPVVAIVDDFIYVIAILQPKTESSYTSSSLLGDLNTWSSWTTLFEVGTTGSGTIETWRNNVVPRGAVTGAQGLPVLLDNLTDDTIWQAVIPQNSSNQPPGVYAGADTEVGAGTPIFLAGVVVDDGIPAGALPSLWTMDSGPGSVTFDDDTDPGTTATFPTLGTYVLRLTATETGTNPLKNFDTVEFAVSSSPPNQPPEISVISPSDLDEFCECETVDFEGTSTDPESGPLTASLDWDSSRDGHIGTGGMFSTNDLSVGDHIITVSVTDGANPVTFDFEITITAEGPYGNTFVDDNSSIFEQDIEWMFAEGITSGCPGTGPLYCPGNTVTRA